MSVLDGVGVVCFRIARGAHRRLAEAAPHRRGRAEAVREVDHLLPLNDPEGIGEHGRAVLEEFGLDEIVIGRLAAEGVLLLPGAP